MTREEIAEIVENAKRVLQVGGDIGEANAPLAEAAKLLSQTTGPEEVDLALLRLIATFPWLLELAEGGFDPELAEALVAREAFNRDPVKVWRMLKGSAVAPPLPAARCTSIAQAAEDERCEKEAGHHGHHLGRRLAWFQVAVLKEQASDLQTPKMALDALKEAEKERDALRALLEEIQAIDDELRTFLGDLEKKLLAPKRFILFYRGVDHAEYTRHMSAYSVKDAYDSFMLRDGHLGNKQIHVMHIEPWTEDCEEWRPWEAQPFPLRDGKFHINRG